MANPNITIVKRLVKGTDVSYAENDANLTALMRFLVPTGSVFPYAGSVVPSSEFLICNGAAVSKTTYADLFAIIGHTYGADPGNGNFILPDLRDKFPLGANGTTRILGTTYGNATQDLSHTHANTLSTASGGAHTHTTSGTTNSTGDHIHSVSASTDDPGGHVHSIAQASFSQGETVAINVDIGSDTGSNGAHTHTITISETSTGSHSHTTSGTAASDGAHTHAINGSVTSETLTVTLLPPSLALNYIIKI